MPTASASNGIGNIDASGTLCYYLTKEYACLIQTGKH